MLLLFLEQVTANREGLLEKLLREGEEEGTHWQ
jgi:hypothetical protein